MYTLSYNPLYIFSIFSSLSYYVHVLYCNYYFYFQHKQN